MSFTALGLSNLLSETISSLYTAPTPLQKKVIPAILQNDDLMVAAPAGEGKIGGFILPIIEKLFPNGEAGWQTTEQKQAHTLILAASSEQAIRITDYFKAYASNLPLSIASILNGVSITPQVKIMENGVNVLVACPERLLELVNQSAIDLSNLKVCVLDEADRLTDDSFMQQTQQIVGQLPTSCQNILFSLTKYNNSVLELANTLLTSPTQIDLTPKAAPTEKADLSQIKQAVYYAPVRQKSALLLHLIQKNNWSQVLVFARTKHGANNLADYFEKKGIIAVTIHSNKTQNTQQKTVNDFTDRKIPVLIATDIAIQNLEIKQLPCVVNFDLPFIEEDYIQRVSCTRNDGEAISLVSTEEEKLLLVIESAINQKIADGDMQDFIFDETELNSEEPERFRRIFRHPAVGRKSRKKKPTKDNEFNEETVLEAQAPQTHEETLLEKTVRPAIIPRAATTTRTKRGQNLYNKHRKQVVSAPLEMPPDRPDDEFRDDDYDNFGNSVDYVSPYKGKNPQQGNRRQIQTAAPAARSTGTSTSPATNNRPMAAKPRTARVANKPQTGTGTQEQRRTPRNSLYKRKNTRGYNPIDTTPALAEPSEMTQRRSTNTTAPAIIHRKHSRLDKLPTIEQLDSMPNHHVNRTEKPALLTRKSTEPEHS